MWRVDIGPQWKTPALFRLGTINYIDSLNPFVGYETQSYNTYNMLYPQLVQYNAHQQLVGDWAKSWSSNFSWNCVDISSAPWREMVGRRAHERG